MKMITTVFVLFLLLQSNGKAEACQETSILEPAPFMGHHDEIFRLANGTIWKVQFAYEYLYEYYPRVVICPDQGKLIVKGKTLNVLALSPVPRDPMRPPTKGKGPTKIPGQIEVVAARSGCGDW